MTAMTKREYGDDDSARVKRVKTESNGEGKMDAAANPYLAHWNDENTLLEKSCFCDSIIASDWRFF